MAYRIDTDKIATSRPRKEATDHRGGFIVCALVLAVAMNLVGVCMDAAMIQFSGITELASPVPDHVHLHTLPFLALQSQPVK